MTVRLGGVQSWMHISTEKYVKRRNGTNSERIGSMKSHIQFEGAERRRLAEAEKQRFETIDTYARMRMSVVERRLGGAKA